ncbi:hypothetical protein E1B28_005381 [Marasmius oreades]|uniref:Uncharacterized protein n=1 Tax=Marasmius oreades TaxID=181124 RepID=A0A9P7S3L0_9AGAR|nr:uncharacterized protein E1B28_005381 [Marasmius oreades]KAG7094553.1 hypothetical protein E1B28_005381 [Marasmius oreades]
MSGLGPTMVIARVAYGKSVESVQHSISTFCIANTNAQATQQGSTAGMQQMTINFSLQTQPGIALDYLQAMEEPLANQAVVEKV